MEEFREIAAELADEGMCSERLSHGSVQAAICGMNVGWEDELPELAVSAAPRTKPVWTAEEDKIIIAAVAQYGTQWPRVAAELPGRTADSVRNRYHRLQRGNRQALGIQRQSAHCAEKAAFPTSPMSIFSTPHAVGASVLKGDHSRSVWSAQEDDIIREGVRRVGCKWRQIAAMLPDRSDSSIRNRWKRIANDDTGVRKSSEPLQPACMQEATTLPSSVPPAPFSPLPPLIVPPTQVAMGQVVDVIPAAGTTVQRAAATAPPAVPPFVAAMPAHAKGESRLHVERLNSEQGGRMDGARMDGARMVGERMDGECSELSASNELIKPASSWPRSDDVLNAAALLTMTSCQSWPFGTPSSESTTKLPASTPRSPCTSTANTPRSREFAGSTASLLRRFSNSLTIGFDASLSLFRRRSSSTESRAGSSQSRCSSQTPFSPPDGCTRTSSVVSGEV